MNYQQTIEFLFSQLPMFSRVGSAAYKKDLNNIVSLCNNLDNPQHRFKTIHVGGTNGKGSVSHMLSAIFQESGYKTGLYTSPHLYDFRERIRINGEKIDENFVVGFVEKIRPSIETIEPSFFEITVAMAFSFFAEQNVDIAIIEVGLGGRLDSTNIIHPELSVITNIGWDHASLLGDSLEKIAFEKAGIIKKEVPVVIGERQPQLEEVFLQAAHEKNAPISFASDHFQVRSHSWSRNLMLLEVKDPKNETIEYELDLPGIYQLKNLCTVLQAVRTLSGKGWKITPRAIEKALKNVKQLTGLYGRWDIIQTNPLIVLEVAHNEAGMEQMLKHIHEISFERLHIIIGMVKDKDLQSILKILPRDASYYFTQAHIPRAVPAEELCEKARPFQLKGNYFEDVNQALAVARSRAGKYDLVIVCGSIFLVAEVEKDLK